MICFVLSILPRGLSSLIEELSRVAHLKAYPLDAIGSSLNGCIQQLTDHIEIITACFHDVGRHVSDQLPLLGRPRLPRGSLVPGTQLHRLRPDTLRWNPCIAQRGDDRFHLLVILGERLAGRLLHRLDTQSEDHFVRHSAHGATARHSDGSKLSVRRRLLRRCSSASGLRQDEGPKRYNEQTDLFPVTSHHISLTSLQLPPHT